MQGAIIDPQDLPRELSPTVVLYKEKHDISIKMPRILTPPKKKVSKRVKRIKIAVKLILTEVVARFEHITAL